MNEIVELLTKYKKVVSDLELISRNKEAIDNMGKVRDELITTKKELESLKKERQRLIQTNEFLLFTLRRLNEKDICKYCGGEGSFEVGYGQGEMCGDCGGGGIVESPF